jgi:ABC-type multidrug transport system fused ATPase/permease subunit
VLLVFASVLLSELSKAWLLYLGLVFLFMVMYAPGGIASLIMMNLRLAKFGKLRGLWPSYLALGGTALVAVLGAAAMVEMTYHLQLNAALGPDLNFLGPLRPTRWAAGLAQGLCCSRGLGCSSCVGASLCSNGGRSRKRSNTKSSGGGAVNMATNAPCALELRDLRKSFGKTEIIRGVNLAVQPGERVAIIGPNGAGKSTLFNLISGRFGPPAARCCSTASASTARPLTRSTAWGCRAASRSPTSSPS